MCPTMARVTRDSSEGDPRVVRSKEIGGGAFGSLSPPRRKWDPSSVSTRCSDGRNADRTSRSGSQCQSAIEPNVVIQFAA